MSVQDDQTDRPRRCVRARQRHRHPLRRGRDGEPLVLLHGGVVSTGPLWRDHPVRLRRPHGRRSRSTSGSSPPTPGCRRHRARGRHRVASRARRRRARPHRRARSRPPMVGGFSEGAITATMLGIRTPTRCGRSSTTPATTCSTPKSPSFIDDADDARRQPRSHARLIPTPPNAFFAASPEMGDMFEMMKADHDGAQGDGLLAHVRHATPSRAPPSRPATPSTTSPRSPRRRSCSRATATMFCSVEDARHRLPQAAERRARRSCPTPSTSSPPPDRVRRSSSSTVTRAFDQRVTSGGSGTDSARVLPEGRRSACLSRSASLFSASRRSRRSRSAWARPSCIPHPGPPTRVLRRALSS